ncbi:LysR family transcriptional regulator [Bradyrhizobium sp. 30]|uniref:LysR family transcriptional regulator n=1 Tax=Bradyrhizobium sp. 30 TaxID=2782669 RepID=UPI001FF96836|nr:LysR family transcriptional regulator [Bradyrhizobium sp. 30]
MHHIDPVSLQLFLAVVREGSIKRAAESEHIAQSALSRRMADLEHALGVPLLMRSSKGVQLTEAGERAHALGKRLNEDLEAFVREVRSLSGNVAGIVRLFASPSSVVGFLPEKLQAFRAAYPEVEIALQERATAEILRACLDDRADVGVGAALKDVPRGVEAWHLADDPLIVVLPRKHPLTKLRKIPFADVLKFPLIGMSVGGALDNLLREKAESIHAVIRQPVGVTSYDAGCRMIEVGLGIAIMPSSAVSAYAGTNRFVRRPLDEAWRGWSLRLYALRKSTRLRAVEALIGTLRA